MENQAIQKLDERLRRINILGRNNVLRHVYGELALSHKGRKKKGDYGRFLETSGSDEKFEFLSYVVDLLKKYGLESHSLRLHSQHHFGIDNFLYFNPPNVPGLRKELLEIRGSESLFSVGDEVNVPIGGNYTRREDTILMDGTPIGVLVRVRGPYFDNCVYARKKE